LCDIGTEQKKAEKLLGIILFWAALMKRTSLLKRLRERRSLSKIVVATKGSLNLRESFSTEGGLAPRQLFIVIQLPKKSDVQMNENKIQANAHSLLIVRNTIL